jgi:hypothetical protein
LPHRRTAIAVSRDRVFPLSGMLIIDLSTTKLRL